VSGLVQTYQEVSMNPIAITIAGLEGPSATEVLSVLWAEAAELTRADDVASSLPQGERLERNRPVVSYSMD